MHGTHVHGAPASYQTAPCSRAPRLSLLALLPRCPSPAAPPSQAIVDGLGEVLFQYPFRVPAYYALILRSLTVLEGLALQVRGWAGAWAGGRVRGWVSGWVGG